jgi:hypothetical protein
VQTRITRVRASDPAIAAIIRDSTAMSPTFRDLVRTVDETDGIVYVETGKCGHGVRACLAMSVTVAGPHRILRILIDARKLDWDLVGSIGHELRHVIELLADPTVTSGFALYFFYQREASHRPGAEGSHQPGAFETNAAIDTGDAVRGEIRAHQKSARR